MFSPLIQFLQGAYSLNDFIIFAVVMVFALIFHNVFQAWIASRYGDPSPRFSGFLSFDPQQHLEPIGVLLLFVFGLGWPKPIPTNSRNYSGRGRQEALVWYSGPLAYLIVAFFCVLLAAVFVATGNFPLARSFNLTAGIAVVHAVLNLFPVYPLDGAKAALAWGNADVRRFVQQVASFGLLGFIVVLFIFSAVGLTGGLVRFFLGLFARIISLIPGL